MKSNNTLHYTIEKSYNKRHPGYVAHVGHGIYRVTLFSLRYNPETGRVADGLDRFAYITDAGMTQAQWGEYVSKFYTIEHPFVQSRLAKTA
jgi:hypothetical protein